jgi:Ca-activated chloride channel family protein
MSFIVPQLLWLLLLVPAMAAAYVLLQRRRKAYAVRFTNLELLATVAPKSPGWRRHVAPALLLATLIMLIGAAARPVATFKVPREQASIMLVMDVSRSMLAGDVTPNRMTAAKSAARDFVDSLPEPMRVGVVSFSDYASLVAPLTVDKTVVQGALDGLQTQAGTAMGDGLAVALNQIARERLGGEKVPASILVLSDGESNQGIPAALVAQEAKGAAIPVYTIGLGTPNGVVEANGRLVPTQLNEYELKAVAEATDGRYFESASAESLDEVYKSLGSSLGYREEKKEITSLAAGLGAVLLVAAAMFSLLWFQRIP